MKTWLDDEGDYCVGIEIGPLTVFTTTCEIGRWTIHFGLTSEIDNNYTVWSKTLTGMGAFKTIQLIRPAIVELISMIEARGEHWCVCADPRRAKFYKRYLPEDKVIIYK